MWELQSRLHLHQAKEKKSPSTGSRVSYVPIKKQSTSGNLKFISFKRQAHLGGFFNISLLFLGVESQILVFVLITLFFCQVRFDRIELSTLIL